MARLKVTIQGIDIPLKCERADEFCTPEWDEILRFYPNYRRAAQDKRQEVYAIQPYMLAIAKELAKLGADESDEAILKRYFAHYGTMHFAEFVARYSNGV